MGNTKDTDENLYGDKDHPHIHGEYQTGLYNMITQEGSPPHTWGIRHVVGAKTAKLGITPTYMGNTTRGWSKNGQARDHPHIHGEYHTILIVRIFLVGSPPHTWGIQQGVNLGLRVVRITPTYMGNTDK